MIPSLLTWAIDHLPPLPPPPEPLIIAALSLLLRADTFPALVCCNMGRHRTGTVVGCYRKLQRWALSSILEEYRRYAGMKVRVLNEQVGESGSLAKFPSTDGPRLYSL
jgi:tyrosine-protein phosphatase OCA1